MDRGRAGPGGSVRLATRARGPFRSPPHHHDPGFPPGSLASDTPGATAPPGPGDEVAIRCTGERTLAASSPADLPTPLERCTVARSLAERPGAVAERLGRSHGPSPMSSGTTPSGHDAM